MKHTYIHKEGDKLYVVISDEKVPERLLVDFENEIKFWLSKSTTYEVYPDQVEKFKPVILHSIAIMEKHVENTVDEWLQGYIQIPNEVVKIDRWNPQDYKQYAFFVQPEERKLDENGLPKDEFRKAAMSIDAGDRPKTKMRVIKKQEPEEKDLLPSDEEIFNHVERVYFHHSNDVVIAAKDCAKWMRDLIKKRLYTNT